MRLAYILAVFPLAAFSVSCTAPSEEDSQESNEEFQNLSVLGPSNTYRAFELPRNIAARLTIQVTTHIRSQ